MGVLWVFSNVLDMRNFRAFSKFATMTNRSSHCENLEKPARDAESV